MAEVSSIKKKRIEYIDIAKGIGIIFVILAHTDFNYCHFLKNLSTIRWTLANYATAIDDFKYYRASIAYEKEEFEAQIRKLFLIENK